MPVSGFDYVVTIRGSRENPGPEDTSLAAVVSRESRSIRVVRRGQLLIEVPLDSLIVRGMKIAGRRRYAMVPSLSLVAEAQNPRARARIFLRQLSLLDRSPAPAELNSASGEVLLKLK
jgi:hypothetical protein